MIMLSADGHSLADRATVPMSAAQVRWFCDPVVFLEHVPHLWTLDLRLFCQRCWKRGLKDDVRVRWNEMAGTFHVVCACARTEATLTPANVAHFASSTDEFLNRVGWSLCCAGRCAHESEMADGVEARNDTEASVLTITCGCTVRKYLMPAQPAGRPS